MRPLGIPAVRDRVAQEVLRQLLSPVFEPLFHEDSFGFRPSAISSAKLSHGAGEVQNQGPGDYPPVSE